MGIFKLEHLERKEWFSLFENIPLFYILEWQKTCMYFLESFSLNDSMIQKLGSLQQAILRLEVLLEKL